MNTCPDCGNPLSDVLGAISCGFCRRTLAPAPSVGGKNIVPIDENAAKELEIRLKKEPHAYCESSCRNVFVVEGRRILECQDCGRAIEPFDHMLRWAREAWRCNEGLRAIRVQTKIAQAEFLRLEKAIDSIRGKLKRDGHPQSEDERAQFRNDLCNWEQPRFSVEPK